MISTSNFMFLSLSPKSQEQSKISDMYICRLILIIYSILYQFKSVSLLTKSSKTLKIGFVPKLL
jgi:hypothetical protein